MRCTAALLAFCLGSCGGGGGSVSTPAGGVGGGTVHYIDSIGDSSTIGAHYTPAQAFPALLGQYFGYGAQNLGQSGTTAVGMVTSELPAMLKNCAVVTLVAGENDEYHINNGTETLAEYQAAMLSLVAGINANCPLAYISIGTIVGNGSWANQYGDPVKNTINAYIASLPSIQPVPVGIVDINADPNLHFSTPAQCAVMYWTDCAHPNPTGYMEYARLFEADIAPHLPRPGG